VRLHRLQLLRSPGLDRSIELEGLDPGFNIVFGPNGSGKSSLCRGIAGLLWESGDFRGAVEGEWEVGGERRGCLRYEGLAPRWEPEGQPPPRLPEGVHRSAFSFSVDDFRTGSSDGDTKALRAHLRRVLAAGVDLVSARGVLLEPRPSSRVVRDQVAALDRALLEERELRTHHEGLLGEARELDRLRGELAEAAAAMRTLSSVESAVRLAEAREALRLAEQRVEGFPEGLERLRGDEGERLATLAGRVATLEAERSRAADDGTRLEEALRGLALTHELPPDDLKELHGRLREVREAERELKRIGLVESGARERIAAADADLHPLAQDGGEGAWTELDRLLRDLPAREQAHEALGIQLDALAAGAQVEAVDGRALARGIAALARWLEGDGEAPDAPPAPGSAWALHAGLAAIAVVVVLGLLGQALWAALAALLAGVFVVVAILAGRRAAGAESTATGQRARSAREFAQLGLEAPSGWEVEAVVERLHGLVELEQREAARRQAEERTRELDARASRLAEEVEQLRESLTELARTLGLAAEGSRLSLADVAQLLERRAADRAALAAALAERSTQEAAARPALERAGELLRRHGQEPALDALELEARIEALEGLVEARRELRVKLREAKLAGEAASAELERVRGDERALLEEAGFLGLEEAVRRERLGLLEEWRDAREQLGRARSAVEAGEAQLAGEPELLGLSRDEALARQESSGARADQHAELQRRIAEITERVRVAETGHELEEAVAEHERVREELRGKREEVLQGAAVEFLLEEIQAEQTRLQRGGLLDEVGALFARFTGDRYALRANAFGDADELPFEIREGDHHVRRFEELSSGTRAQLDLALRLAVAADLEGDGERLPFVIDEALTTSDEARFGAAVAALAEMVRDGRQVFFLTSDGADARRFAEAVVASGLPAPRQYDLEDARKHGRRAEVLEHEPLPEVPAPLPGEDFAAYGRRLGLPRIEPFAPVEELHFAYLCSDSLDAIHELALERVETVGQARIHLERSSRAWRPERRRRFEVLVSAARAWLEVYRTGRTRPVPTEVLHEGLRSGSFGERVASFVADHGGRAERLFEELDRPSGERDPRLKGFRSKSADALRDFLLGRGYLSEDEPSSAEDRRHRAQLAVVSQLEAEDAVVTAEDIAQLAHALEQWVLGADGADAAS